MNTMGPISDSTPPPVCFKWYTGSKTDKWGEPGTVFLSTFHAKVIWNFSHQQKKCHRDYLYTSEKGGLRAILTYSIENIRAHSYFW